MQSTGTSDIGSVMVRTTTDRGFTPEEIAQRAVARILHVGDQSHPAIQAQAHAFKSQLESVLVLYMREAQASARTTMAAKLRKAGYPDLVPLIFD